MDSPRPETSESVLRLIAECLDLLEEGGTDPVEALLEEHPEQAESVRRYLRLLENSGLLQSAAVDDAGFPERLGPFRLLERIGAGGMGVVYRAEQEPLKRIVALKLVRPDLLYFGGARERFRREVEVAARLKHPGIVPVYTVGEEAGIPYFAMEYVEGRSLDQVLSALRGRDPGRLTGRDLMRTLETGDGPHPESEHARRLEGASWVDACFQIVLQLAETLHDAHRQGVLHRDVKPSNVILTPNGRVRLLDFGLASTRGTTRLTRTGSQVGSLPYMSPEQLLGEDVDERTDIYAFGVTLYELLALRLPYLARDPEETRRLILGGTPRSLRHENPAVLADAEIVCLTAMEPDRGRRYATAADFAADLRAILERRPIAARRPGLALRARRYAQRHPARVVGAVLGFVLFAGAVAFGAQQKVVSRRLEAAVGAKDEALEELREANRVKDGLLAELRAANAEKDEALEEAQKGFLRALQATNEMLRRVGYGLLKDVPGAEHVKRELLEEAAALYEALLADRPDDPRVRLESALGFGFLADVLSQVGETDRSVTAAKRSVEMLERLHEEDPRNKEVLDGLIGCYYILCHALNQAGHQEERVSYFLKGARYHRILRDIVKEGGADASELHRADVQVAGSLGDVGMSLSDGLQVKEAREVLVETHGLFEALLEEHPEDGQARHLMAVCCTNLGALLLNMGRYAESEEVLNEGLEATELLMQDRPTDPVLLEMASAQWSNLGAVLWRSDRREGAVEAMDDAALLMEKLVDRYPSTYIYQVKLAGALVQKGSMECDSSRADGAGSTLERALTVADAACAGFSPAPESWNARARALAALGRHYICVERHEAAVAPLRRSLEIADEIVQRWPEARASIFESANAASTLAQALMNTGRIEEARPYAERGVAETVLLTREEEIELGPRLCTLADVALAQQDHEAARKACRRLLRITTNAPEYYRGAVRMTRCLALLGEPAGFGDARRTRLVEECTDDALALLERAFERGFGSVEKLRTDPELAALRGDGRFEGLIARLVEGD